MLLRPIKQKLKSSGFDLCHPVHTVWYNHLIQNEGLVESGALKNLPEPSPSLQDDGRDEKGMLPSYNAVLIGNTKAMWPSFINWLAEKKVEENKKRQDISGGIITQQHEKSVDDDVIHSNPFDTYCEESLSRSLQELCCGDDVSKKITSYELFWSNGKRQKFATNNPQSQFEGHDVDDDVSNNNKVQAKQQYHCFDNKQDSYLVSMQRVASISGQYWHDEENTKLCVHPVYGTWTAFRALVIFETEHSYIDNNSSSSSVIIPSAPSQCPCPLSEEEMKEAKKIFYYALEMNTSSGQGNNVGSYGTQSNKSWDELCTFLHNQVCQGSDWEEVPESMKPWIELRNSISVGRREWKYDEAQLLYHYTKDPNILRRELERINK
jgi:hypothetical protein